MTHLRHVYTVKFRLNIEFHTTFHRLFIGYFEFNIQFCHLDMMQMGQCLKINSLIGRNGQYSRVSKCLELLLENLIRQTQFYSTYLLVITIFNCIKGRKEVFEMNTTTQNDEADTTFKYCPDWSYLIIKILITPEFIFPNLTQPKLYN